MNNEIEIYSVAFSDHTFIGITADKVSSEEEAVEAAKEVKRSERLTEMPTVTLVELVTLK